jgi:phenylalanyl-tRNA synthetase beta chain
MPVITFDYNDFIDLLGYEISKEEFINRIPMIGADFDKSEDDSISIEFFPDRPDLSSVEGIARAARAFFGFRPGMKTYEVLSSDVIMTVDPSVKKIRPYVQCSIVKNVRMTDELIASLMDLQEKLHIGIGRNRKKVAIGVHNLEPLQPPFIYKAVDPTSVQFIPLAKVEAMTLKHILTNHEKGIAYAHLLDGFDKYPLIVDANNNVLSFPPIINGTLTEVTPFTTEIFIDVTGTNPLAIQYALHIVTTALAERGGQIHSTTIIEGDTKKVSPDLTPKIRPLSISYVNRILGTTFDAPQIDRCLLKMGHQTKTISKDTLEVHIPSWRADILHEIDLVEDVAIGYGYDKFQKDLPSALTFGKKLPNQIFYDRLRMILVGFGFNEVTTFTLSNDNDEFKKLGLPPGKRIEIQNPIGEEYSCIRVSLVPSLLKLLAENKHHSLPQQIFELGLIVDEKHMNQYHLGGIKSSAKASFTECKSLVEAILRETGIAASIIEKYHPAFIEGRCAAVVHKQYGELGFFGELHPRTITNFSLEHPSIAFEFTIHLLVDSLNAQYK